MALNKTETTPRAGARVEAVFALEVGASGDHRAGEDDGESAPSGEAAIASMSGPGAAGVVGGTPVAGGVDFLIADSVGWTSAAAADGHDEADGPAASAADQSGPDLRERAGTTSAVGSPSDVDPLADAAVPFLADAPQDEILKYVERAPFWSDGNSRMVLGYLDLEGAENLAGTHYTYDVVVDPAGKFRIDDDFGSTSLYFNWAHLDDTVVITCRSQLVHTASNSVIEEYFVDIIITPEDVYVNVPPSVGLSISPITENTVGLVGTYNVFDYNEDELTFELTGANAHKFELRDGKVYQIEASDYEQDHWHDLTLTATDPFGVSTSDEVRVGVRNVNEAPADIRLSSATIAENGFVNQLVGALTARDPEKNEVSFRLIDDADGAFSIINGIDGSGLLANKSFDFESSSKYTIVVEVTDRFGLAYQKTFTISVADINEAPVLQVSDEVGVLEAVAELGTVIATLSVSDQDGDDVSLRLTSNPGGLFEIVDGEIVLAKRMTEAVDGSVEVTVEASDGRGGVTTETITVEIDKSVQTGDGKDNTLIGDAGRNVFSGRGGDDDLTGLGGNDKLVGDGGDDVLKGGLGGDAMIGGAGGDTASYAAATAGVTANLARQNATTGEAAGDSYKGVENLAGSAFADRLTGDGKANRLDGADGDDSLEGGSGDDALTGGDGIDELAGGIGRDKLSGGLGPDSLVWNEQREAGDVVLDFVSDGDLLVFSVDGWKGMTEGSFKLAQSDDPVATGDKRTFLFDRDSGKLWFDADGAGEGDAVFVATLRDVDKLKASDFDLV